MLTQRTIDILDQAVEQYNHPDFILDDPIRIPHQFHKIQDIEIAGILTATIAWGKRTMILNNATKLMQLMDQAPHDFVLNAQAPDLRKLEKFVHRTFNSDDLLFFIEALKSIYKQHESLEDVFLKGYTKDKTVYSAIESFRDSMFNQEHLKRSEKHISSPVKGSAAKRINMFIRANKVVN